MRRSKSIPSTSAAGSRSVSAIFRANGGESVQRADIVRKAFNSPFRPFILASTSIGQEGLDFHTYCHAVYHWNLPHNPVDLEQREGRVHRYKGHAVRKNVAEVYGLDRIQTDSMDGLDPWKVLFQRARDDRTQDSNDLIPYCIFEQGRARVERRVPLLPFSREVDQLRRLLGSLAVYRLAFGQPRQEDLVEYLRRRRDEDAGDRDLEQFRISLAPPNGVPGRRDGSPMDKSPLLERPGRRSQDGRWSGSCRGDRSRSTNGHRRRSDETR